MSILIRLLNASSRLKTFEEVKNGAETAKQLEALRDQLQGISSPLNLMTERVNLFKSQGVALSPFEGISKSKTMIEEISNRLTEAPTLTTLTLGVRWKRLTENLAATKSDVEINLTNDWKKYFINNFFGGVDPDKRSRELTQTPENQRLLNAYRSTYTTFIKYKNTFPESNEAFEELRNASETLAQIRFDEDIPNSVKLFFEATNRGGASLELLTDEVVTWLRTKNSLGSYIVSAKN